MILVEKSVQGMYYFTLSFTIMNNDKGKTYKILKKSVSTPKMREKKFIVSTN